MPEDLNKIIEMRKAGKTTLAIASELGIKESRVTYLLHKNGIKLDSAQRSKNGRNYDPAKILELRSKGLSIKRVAEQIGCSTTVVKRTQKAAGLQLPKEIGLENLRAGIKAIPQEVRDRITQKSHSQEANAKRTVSITKAYRNPQLIELKRTQGKETWAAKTLEQLAQWSKECSMRTFSHRLKRAGFASHEEWMHFRAEKLGGKYLGPFTHSHDKTNWECANGHIFEAKPYTVGLGHWCPHCANVGVTTGHQEILDFLNKEFPSIQIEISKRNIIPPLELDIYIPSLKLAIEYNGLFWHSAAVGKDATSHMKKFLRCEEQGIKLFSVFEDEWHDKKDLIKDMISARLGKFKESIYARDTEVVELTALQAQSFFDLHHIDGYVDMNNIYGLKLKDSEFIVSAMGLRRNFAKELEIARFCSVSGFRVIGAFSRLLKYVRGGSTEPLISYSNNRIGFGEVYAKNGFELIRYNRPSYWYTDGRGTRIWRWKCKRDNTPEVLAEFPTELEQALGGVFSEKIFGDKRKLYKIHDYGHKKWVLK